MVEGEQSLFGKRRNKLNGEKRIARRFAVHQLRERGRRAPARSAENRRLAGSNLQGQGAQGRSPALPRSGLADRIELAHQRMGGANLVVPIGADQQQIPHIRLGQQIFDQIERCRIKPLQIVEKKCQRMLRPCETRQ